ncbi:response regulator transcription factor [uncultured Tessaracoccus sp.]|uniref:response regulator transcription factor n=1 Tax=uncultured Tessaracoccus sp. TaxID=905023 RepID=UPI002634EE6D|nr:response regulator transcription factor [uncultured Tessaracoccus sp.]
MIRILIADDHPIVRAGLRAVFEAEPDFQVVGEVDRALDAVDRAKVGGIDLITMDLRFPSGPSGVDAVERIQSLDDPPAVLVLTNYDTDTDILRAVEAGAGGYLLKDSPADVLVRGVRDAAAGRPVLAPAVASKLMHRLRTPSLQLTARERDVLLCLDRGLSNQAISAELFLSRATVKSHLARLYSKLGVSSRTAALAKAREQGLLD